MRLGTGLRRALPLSPEAIAFKLSVRPFCSSLLQLLATASFGAETSLAAREFCGVTSCRAFWEKCATNSQPEVLVAVAVHERPVALDGSEK